MSSYTCGRCDGGPTGMTGHYGKVCHVTARVENRQGVDSLLDNPFHFCCPGDCELLNEDGSPKPKVDVEADVDGDFLAPADTFCHTVRDDDPCVLRADDGDVHEDPDGTEYRQEPLTRKEVRRD